MQSKSVTIATAAVLLLAICCPPTTQILAVERTLPITLTDTYELSSPDADDADADADRDLVKRQTSESTGTGVIATGGAAASAAMTAMAISTVAGAPGGAASRRQNKYDREDMARGDERTASRVIYRSDEDDDGFETARQRPVSAARAEPKFSTTGTTANRSPPSPASLSRQRPQEAPEQQKYEPEQRRYESTQRKYEPMQRKYESEPREYRPKYRPSKQKRVDDNDDDDCNYDEEDFNPGKQYQKMFNMAIVPMQAYMQNMMGQMIARVPAPKIQGE